ncbi:metalloprotease TIKI1 [Tachysurus ichikawai]
MDGLPDWRRHWKPAVHGKRSSHPTDREDDNASDVESPIEAFFHEDQEWRHMEEEEDTPPHLLLPDSLELLEKVERKLKKKRRNRLKKQRHRQFNDLWVRMEESTTLESPQPVVRIINGYITVQSDSQAHGRSDHDRTFSGSTHTMGGASFTMLILCLQVMVLLGLNH